MLKRMSLRWKVLIPVVGAIFVLVGVIFIVSQFIIDEQAQTMALTKVRSDISLMYELLDEMLPGAWRGEGPLLYKGEHLLNNDEELVDWLASLTGNTVTIFRAGMRVATTVRSDGERVVGTEAAPYVVEQVLGKQEPYYGEAEVAGNRYQAAYRPLWMREVTRGMLNTGASPRSSMRRSQPFERRARPFLIVSVFLTIVLYFILSRGVLQPIASRPEHAVRIAEI